MFNLFNKKKKEEPNPFGRTVRDLDQGYIFEYDLRSWEVKKVYEYDWGHNDFTREYKISDGSETFYLNVEEDDELELVLAKKIKIRNIQSDLPTLIRENETPPDTLVYEGKEFYLDEESPGYFRELPSDDDEDWEEFISWDYYDKSGKEVITLEQWDDRSFDASYGKTIKEFEISNILPREQN
mgnify:CR=1 FL=1